jgi:hypothetical protein
MAIPILGHGDIPTPAEIEQEKARAGQNPETAKERDMAARHYEALRRQFLSAPRARRYFLQRINTGRWLHHDFDVRKVNLDGEIELRWVALQWYKKPGLFRELEALPYPVYVHETRFCPDCKWQGCTALDDCPKCKAHIPLGGTYRELDDEMVRVMHEEMHLQTTEEKVNTTTSALARVQLAKAKRIMRKMEADAKSSEANKEVAARIQHDVRQDLGTRDFGQVPKEYGT